MYKEKLTIKKVFLIVLTLMPMFYRPYEGAKLDLTFVACDFVYNLEGEAILYSKAQQFGLFNVFSRHRITFESTGQFNILHRHNKADLIKDLRTEPVGFFRSLFTTKPLIDASNQYRNATKIEISPFCDHYFGFPSLDDKDNLTVLCDFTVFDAKLPVLFLTGIFLFLFAGSFSRNVLLYYASGVLISLCMSWAVILIIILRLIPYKTPIFIATIFFGGSFGLYLTQTLLLNLHYLASYHSYWLIRYTVVVSLLSLAFMYYKGPPKKPGFFNLMLRCIQLLGLLCIYNSTWASEVAVTAIVLTVATHFLLECLNVSGNLKEWAFSALESVFKWNHQPLKRKLLTEEEYHEEGQLATTIAMEELRSYCSSPDCNVWKYVSRLKDPKKFASFVETGIQLSDDERAEYDKYIPDDSDGSWVSSDEEEKGIDQDETSDCSIITTPDLDV